MEHTTKQIDAFIKTVKEMRQNQKLYFKSRDYLALSKAKKCEREVDLMLVKFNEAPTLFNM